MSTYSKYGQNDTVIQDDGDVSFFRVNNRMRPDQIKQGEVASSLNGRMDIDGAWQVRKGIDSFGPTLTANTQAIQFLSPEIWSLYGSVSISSASRSSTVITINTSSAHGFSSSTLVNISGLSGTIDPNGNRLITVTGSSSFTFTIAGATGTETYTGSGTAQGAAFSDTTTTGVYGSCLFSDPNNNNTRYIIRATNQNAIAVNLSTGASTTIAYPTGITITSSVYLLQCFDKVIIFRSGYAALEWNGVISGTPAFTLVASGLYTQPTYLDDSNNCTITDGVATVTHAAGHGLVVGDIIYVIDKGTGSLVVNTEGYEVAVVVNSTTFKFYCAVPDATAHKAVLSKRTSDGVGLIRMPAPSWGVYHQRRLWVPYEYEPASSSYTARNRKDEIIGSDILDSNTYDHITNQYRITAGISDYVVALEPFAEDNLLVFNRNSIHLVKGVSGALTDTSVWLITKETGCVARRSIQQVANQIIFLSDNGVYSANFGDLYNLRGAGLPLSEPIKASISRINSAYVSGCVSAYFNNRYYLAVPIDGSTYNNAILIYNFLNQGWESIDSSVSGFDIQNLIVGDSGGLSKLYAISSSGSIHIIDERSDANDRLAIFAGVPAASYPISSYVQSRQYTYGTMDRKKFSRFELHVESSESESSDGSVSVEVENPDSTESLTTISSLLGGNLAQAEDASLRGRIGNKRGYGAQIGFSPTNGRPKLRAIKLSAGITNPSITSTT